MNHLLERALQAIAGRCDGAYVEDGVGFNGRDTGFGKQLAQVPEDSWSPKQRFYAHKMLRTYRVQLQTLGIDYDEIPAPADLEQIEVDFIARRKQQRKAEDDRGRKVVVGTTEVEVWFPYDPALVDRVKQVPGRRFKKRPAPHWTIPLTDVSAMAILALVTDTGLAITDEERLRLQGIAKVAEDVAGLSDAMATDFEVRPGLGGTLRPFQAVAVQYMTAKKRVLCGDEMGLGKTIEALATLHHAQAYPALVVVPATLKPNWMREAIKWLPPTVKVGQLSGGKMTARNQAVVEGCDVVIVNYDVLGWTGKKKRERGNPTKLTGPLMERDWAALVADEIHFAKNYKAQRSIALENLAKRPDMVLGLTGTPILNRPQELVHILQVLGRLGDVGGFWGFLGSCGVHRGEYGMENHGTSEMLENVHHRLRQTCMIRRKKEQVLTELPPKVRATVPLSISNRREYRAAATDLVKWLRGQGKAKAAEKAGLAEHLVRIEALKTLAAQGKMKALIDWVSNFVESGEKLVLFAHHRAVQRQLLLAFPGSARLIAVDTLEERDRQVQEFQTGPVPLMVASLKAGGVGITLTAASNVAFAELGWTPGEMDQAEDRCHRMGQLDSVTAWYLLAEQTIEEEIAALIDGKRVVVAALSDGDAVAGERGSILSALVASLAGADQAA